MARLLILSFISVELVAFIAAYDYECKQDYIEVSDLPSTSTSFLAMQNETKCVVAGNHILLKISGCSQEEFVILTHGSYAGMSPNLVHGGKNAESIVIACNQLPAEGKKATVTKLLSAKLTPDDKEFFGLTYNLSSVMNVTEAIIGDPVLWSIYLEKNYYLDIMNCSAYAGTWYSTYSLPLINDWCTYESNLISDFVSIPGTGVAHAVLQAFKFHNFKNVFFACDVLVCPPTGLCELDCDGVEKRSIHNMWTSQPTGSYQESAGSVLRIIDPYTLSSASKSGTTLIIVFLVAAVSLIFGS